MQSIRDTTKYCLDTLGAKEQGSWPLGVFYCQDGKSANQVMTLTKDGEFRREETCAVVWSGLVSMHTCLGSQDQKWHRTSDGAIVHDKSGLCLDITDVQSGKQVHANPCDPSRPGQKWKFDHDCP